MRKGAYGIAFDDNNQLLLAKKNDTYILPWWKHNDGETDPQCIRRELSEELWIPEDDVLIGAHYKDIAWTTPSKNDTLISHNYFIKLKNPWAIKPSGEITELLRTNDFSNYKLSNITQQVIEALQADQLL